MVSLKEKNDRLEEEYRKLSASKSTSDSQAKDNQNMGKNVSEENAKNISQLQRIITEQQSKITQLEEEKTVMEEQLQELQMRAQELELSGKQLLYIRSHITTYPILGGGDFNASTNFAGALGKELQDSAISANL